MAGYSSISSRPNHSHTVLAAGPDATSDHKDHRRDDDGRDAALGEEVDFEGEDDDACAAADGDAITRPQTVEERLAARRKMKRFRLTHQQTRFLMSEFAKQPHPDAAHRERLSREIPGLSPRQVQVWFQNRRAKIKRLTADDRERVVRMRAVPEGFDNVQALHSPYGAVHGLGAPLPPGEPLNPPYGHHMLRPLMVEVRRHDETYISPGALTPSFGNIELGQSGGMSASDLVSPLSSTSSSKYMPESHVSTSSRTMGTSICQHAGLDAVGHMSKPGLRQGQPLHVREPIAKSTGDALQSPLRGGLSWKPETFDYSHYSETNAGPSASERSPSAYTLGPLGGPSGGAIGSFEPPTYSGEPTWP
ncbi:hypothetical protein HIM_06389 [Hirsutella minnesotensis 3608]|uniref:Homeobox domain-containing protein n=1 Tax=Hirsutella minnesotensis 3608 TaxID=1043627 RepID=A0A0F7ZU32_9HYPO|nr:hypothetical protein HIM_06389 [Hirsutella minnesotensis 3608]